MSNGSDVAAGVGHVDTTLPHDRRRRVVLANRRVSPNHVPHDLARLGVKRQQMAIGCAAEKAAVAVSHSTHRGSDAEALWLEVLGPPLLTGAGVDGVSIGGRCDVHRAIDQHRA